MAEARTAGRIGPKQLQLLRVLAGPVALVVACARSRSLTARGLLREAAPGAFVHITSAGLRALADAADAGRIRLEVLPTPTTGEPPR